MMSKYTSVVLFKFEAQARAMCAKLGIDPDKQVYVGEYGSIEPSWFIEAGKLAILHDQMVLLGVIEQIEI